MRGRLRRTYPLLVSVGLTFAWAVPVAATAEPYFISYEADGVYPEDAGWTRFTNDGGAERYFQDGALVLDSRESTNISDAYAWWRLGELDPEPGETFVVQWRLLVGELQGPWDATLSVYSDDRRSATLDFSLNGVHVPGEGFVAAFEPGVFHDFELRSASMVTYDLYVDGVLAHSGPFTPPLLNQSFVAWGDGTLGGASVTHWDHVRFGVTVPEPSSGWLLLTACLMGLKSRG